MKGLPPIYCGRMIEGNFLSRPNRFTVICDVDGLETSAFMPNPGRLGELLLPQARLILADHGVNQGRKTRYTVMAAYYRDQIVFLHTHLNNHIVGNLIAQNAIPSLRGYQVVQKEIRHQNNRFDFLLAGTSGTYVLEVKSCTLAANGIAMFPDAVTERGRRHLEVLAEMCEHGQSAAVLFVIHQKAVTHFLPDYHTDLAFSRTFRDLEGKLPIYAISLKWRPTLEYEVSVPEVAILWETVRRECEDRGHLLKVQKCEDSYRIVLTAYIQGLTQAAAKSSGRVYPICSSIDETEYMTRSLANCYGTPYIDGDAHIFWCEHDPVSTGEFQELLLSFRISQRLSHVK